MKSFFFVLVNNKLIVIKLVKNLLKVEHITTTNKQASL